jgi:hypothetical protein
MGRPVRIQQLYNSAPPDTTILGLTIFEGQIETIKTAIDATGKHVEIIARDFSSTLERITVYGQRADAVSGSGRFLAGLDTVFNPDGRPNASASPVDVQSKAYTIFSAEPSQAKFWTLPEVIDYLLNEYVPIGQLYTPGITQLRALAEDQPVRDLDVTGLHLIEALYRCCERVGLMFKFVPRLADVGPGQAIVFYRNATGRTIELDYQQAGEQLSVSKTNIAVLSSRKSLWPITHKYVGQGDFKVYEATFELIKAWDPVLEDTDYEKFSPSTNSEFYKVKDVYRKWCLNEAADYSNAPYNQGPAFDFSKIFQSKDFTHCRRRFWPALTRDIQKQSLGYHLQVSYDDGLHWWQYLYAFNNLLEECGVWLSSEQLDVDTWVAALKGVLKFRITASVVSDERLSCVVADGPVNSVVPVVEHVVTLPRQFKFRKVSDQSIFAHVCDEALGKPDEVDDSALLYELVRRKSAVSAATIERAKVQTPTLAFDYEVGDKVTSSPESRDLLSCKTDNRSNIWIERVEIDFRKQCTNVRIVRQRG